MHVPVEFLGGLSGKACCATFLPLVVCGDLESSTWSMVHDQLTAFVCLEFVLSHSYRLPHHGLVITQASFKVSGIYKIFVRAGVHACVR